MVGSISWWIGLGLENCSTFNSGRSTNNLCTRIFTFPAF